MKLLPPWIAFRLRAKLTLLIESLVIILVVATGIITTMREKDTLENELRNRGIALANDLAKFSASPLLSNDLATLRRFVIHSKKQDYVHYVIILNPQGNVVMHTDLEEVGKTCRDSLTMAAINAEESGCAPAHLEKDGEHYCDIHAPIRVSGARLGTVRLGYSYSAVAQEIAKAQRQIILIGLVTIVIGGVVAYVLATFISMPIKRITEAMEQVANGDLKSPLMINRNDEIGTLADSFNKMAEDLGRHRKHLEVLVEARTAELGDVLMNSCSRKSLNALRAEEELNAIPGTVA